MRKLLAAIALAAAASLPAQDSSGLAAISFPNSGAPAAQHEFLLGVFQLHNFEYPDALRHFHAAQQLDPHFALAFWGEAMTHTHAVWHEQDQPAALAALARLAPTPEARQALAPTPREKQYLQTLEILYGPGTKPERDAAYAQAMANLHRTFPGDLEATTFYALAILGTAQQGRDFPTYMRAAAVLEEVFPQHPTHPGVLHYLIHCYDDPVHAPLGLRAARLYATVAPDAGHAQHMVSHIFLALGMWDEVVKANEIAMSVVNRRRQAANRPLDECGHYDEWLEYGYLQLGRIDDARRTLETCRLSAEREAKEKPDADLVFSNYSDLASYASMRSFFLLDTQLWTDPALTESLPGVNRPFAQFTFDFTSALAAFNTSSPSAPAALKQLQADHDRALAALAADKSTDPETLQQERRREAILVGQIEALALLHSGESEAAVTRLRALALDEHSMPLEFGPPLVDQPTCELLGEVLLQFHRPAEARAAFESVLASAPNRRRSASLLTASTMSK